MNALAVAGGSPAVPGAIRTTGGHVRALDGLRGVAILLVLFFHYPKPFAWLVPLSSIGWVGVDLFFVLSGYLITGILYATREQANYYRIFYIRRSLRIFPLYYGFLTVLLLLLPLFIRPYWLGLEELNGKLPFFLYYINYDMFFHEWPPLVVAAFWSLAIEEHFYLFWPLFIRLTPSNKLLGRCGLIICLVLFGRLLIPLLHINWVASYFLTTSRMDSLVIGSMTAIAVRQRPDWLKHWSFGRTTLALAGLLAALGIWRRGLAFDDWPMRTFGYTLLAMFFAGLMRQAGTTRGRLSRALDNPVLVWFGKYSYGLYVFHMLVLVVCERWLGPSVFPKLGWGANAPLPLLLTSLTILVVCAWLSWNLYERRFLAFKDRFNY